MCVWRRVDIVGMEAAVIGILSQWKPTLKLGGLMMDLLGQCELGLVLLLDSLWMYVCCFSSVEV